MSDFRFEHYVGRDAVSRELAQNEEQFVYVVTNAFSQVEIEFAIEVGQLGDEADAKTAVAHLRALADAIEGGEIT